MVNGWLENVHSWLLPPSCVLCGDAGQVPVLDLCAACADDLPVNGNPCSRCAMPLVRPGAPCGSCLLLPRPFDSAIAPYLYAYPLDHLVRAFKYSGALSHARILGTLFSAHVRKRAQPLPQLLIPVPLHRSRYRERGFNQATELARIIGGALRIRVDDRLCQRVRATGDQTELTAAERAKNVRGAFAVGRSLPGSHVAIVDDVLTTGSTASALAQVLKEAGAGSIEVWAIARAK